MSLLAPHSPRYTGVSDAKKQSSPRAHPGCYGGGCVTSRSDAAYSRLCVGCTMACVDGSHNSLYVYRSIYFPNKSSAALGTDAHATS